MLDNAKYAKMLPKDVRELVRREEITWESCGMCEGYAQGNLAILPKEYAFDFLLFAQRNPKPCPIIDVTELGSKEFKFVAPGSDVTTDLARYRVWVNGELVDDVHNIKKYWRDDLVAFLIGCSNSFEPTLFEAGIRMRYLEEGKRKPVYISNIPLKPAGPFGGPMIVSMIPVRNDLVSKAVTITSRFPNVHGVPVHIGYPEKIGIMDLNKPDFGDPVDVEPNETPVFWACGVTPQSAIRTAKPSFAITHDSGHLLITDVKLTHLCE